VRLPLSAIKLQSVAAIITVSGLTDVSVQIILNPAKSEGFLYCREKVFSDKLLYRPEFLKSTLPRISIMAVSSTGMNLRCGLKISDIFSEIVSVSGTEFLPYE